MEQQQLFEEFFGSFLGSEDFALTDRGRRIAWTIYSAAIREEKKIKQEKIHQPLQVTQEFKSETAEVLQYLKNDSTGDKKDVTETLKKLKKSLQRILHLFQNVNDARDGFLSNFYGWSFLRLKCITELKSLKTSLDYALYRCNVSEAVMGSFKFAAGTALLGSLLFPFCIPIMPLIGVGLAGGGVAGGASVLLWRYLASNGIITSPSQEDAKKLLMKERQSLPSIENWFTCLNDLVTSVETLIGLEVVKVMYRDWKLFLVQLRRLNNEVWAKPILSQCIRNAYASNILHNKFGPLLAPVIVTFLFVVFLFHEKNRFLFDCALKSKNLNFSSSFELDDDTDLLEAIEILSEEYHSLENIRSFLTEFMLEEKTYSASSELEEETKNECKNTSEDTNLDSNTSEEAEEPIDQEKNNINPHIFDYGRKTSNIKDDSIHSNDESVDELDGDISAIIVMGVPQIASANLVVRRLISLLPKKVKKSLKIHKIIQKDRERHWVIKGKPEALRLLLHQEEIIVSRRKCRIRKFFEVTVCKNCQFFGHDDEHCYKETVCAECSGNHQKIECDTEEMCCPNCKRYNALGYEHFHTDHPAYADCPTFNNMLQHLKEGKPLKTWLIKMK